MYDMVSKVRKISITNEPPVIQTALLRHSDGDAHQASFVMVSTPQG